MFYTETYFVFINKLLCLYHRKHTPNPCEGFDSRYSSPTRLPHPFYTLHSHIDGMTVHDAADLPRGQGVDSSRASLLGGVVVAVDGRLERCRFEVDFVVQGSLSSFSFWFRLQCGLPP